MLSRDPANLAYGIRYSQKYEQADYSLSFSHFLYAPSQNQRQLGSFDVWFPRDQRKTHKIYFEDTER